MSLSGSGDTGSGSVEVSVRTDLTVTSDGDSEDAANVNNTNKKRYAKEIHSLTADKTQLQQVVEKLRLELQGRDAQLLATKSRYEALLNQQETQIGIRLSEKQAIINRLEAKLRTGNEESRILKERAANELAHLMEKCLQFQHNQERLKVKHDEVKRMLNDITITEAEYQRLSSHSEDELNLQQLVSLRLHKLIVPLRIKIREHESIKSSLENTVTSRERDLETLKQENIRLEHQVGQLSGKFIDSVKQCDDLRKDLKQDDYRIYNFERIKKERDKYEEEKELLSKERANFEVAASVYKKEKEVLEDRLSELKIKFRHQEMELSRSQNELQDLRKHFDSGKEDMIRTYSHLKSERERSEEFQEKFLKARAEIVLLSDTLKDCQNAVSICNEKLLNFSKSEEEIKERYNSLLIRYDEISVDLDSLQSKYLKEKDIFKQELSETKANFNTISKNYTDLLNENAKWQKDSQFCRQDQQEKLFSMERETTNLKREITELQKKLDVYKSLENDYLSTLRSVAAVPITPTSISNKNALGYPTSSIVQGKLSEETISLTRRILNLERENVEACVTIQKLTTSLSEMRSCVVSYKAAIGMAGKPSVRLLERISSQEEQILALELALQAANESKQLLTDELSKVRNELTEASKQINEDSILHKELKSIKLEINSMENIVGCQDTNNRNSNKKPTPYKLPSAIKITKLGLKK